jgi:ankyrin repeat protein
LTWSSLAFCGDILIYNSIHDAAFDGDLEKVIALLNYHPELVSSKDKNGQTPLHLAVISGYMNG